MGTEEKKHQEAPHSTEAASEDQGYGAGEPLEATIQRLADQLAAKTQEAKENYDRFLRERAELENFKRRMQRERAEALRYATEGLVRELIPVLDNLERSIEHAEGGGNGQPLVAGVRLVLKNALDVLERHGISRVEAKGARFDPALHEAITQIQDPDREPNQVVDQFLPGYRLHDRLLRPAQVSVSTKPPVEKPEDDD